jgi:hypothetical protein
LPFYKVALDSNSVSFSMVATARFVNQGIIQLPAEQSDSCRYLYPKLVASFIQSRGKLVDYYWAPSCVAGVILLEETRKFIGLRLGRALVVHGVCNATEPVAAHRLSVELDQLGSEAARLLSRRARNVALEKIFSTNTLVLGQMSEFAEAAGRPTRRRSKAKGSSTEATLKKPPSQSLATLASMVQEIRDSVKREALRRAEELYLLGTLTGLIALGVAIGTLALSIPTATLGGLPLTAFVGPLLAGGIGALMSIMLRTSNGDLNVDWEAGRTAVVLTGFLRPLIGALSAGVVYLFVKTGLVSLVGSNTSQSDAFFLAVGFIAGFGERWVPDMLASTTKSLTRTQSQSSLDQSARTRRPPR